MLKYLKITLWISAVGCLLATPFIVLPWNMIESIFRWYGVETIFADVVGIYLFRIICGISGLMGIFFIILAKNPLKYANMLNLGAYGLIFFGLLSLTLGLSLGISVKLYIVDALFGLVLGLIIAGLSFKISK